MPKWKEQLPPVTACVYVSIKRPLAALKSLVLSALLCKSSIQGSSTSFIHSFIYIKRKMSEASDWKDGTSIDMYSSGNGRVCVFFSISSTTTNTTTIQLYVVICFLDIGGCLFPFRWARSSFPLLWFSFLFIIILFFVCYCPKTSEVRPCFSLLLMLTMKKKTNQTGGKGVAPYTGRLVFFSSSALFDGAAVRWRLIWCLSGHQPATQRIANFIYQKRSQSKSYPLVFVAGGRSLSMQSPHPVNILDGLLCPYISLMFVCLFVCRFVINRHIVSLRTFRLSIHRRTGIDRHRSNTFDSPISAQRSCTHI